MQRRGKQAFIIFVYFLILALFCTGIFFAFFYQKPSCLDGKKNQDETGIDCGGRCSQYCLADLASRPLVISEVETLAYGTASSDAIGRVKNQNAKAALKNATYTFTFYDEAENVINEQSGTFSLLPLEERILPVFGLGVPKESIAKTTLTIKNEEWVAFPDFTEPPEIRVANPQFTLLTEGGYAEVRGLVQNFSFSDIRTLAVVVVIRDENNKALSVNRTTLDNLISGQQRDFRLLWPEAFKGQPRDVETQVHFDMLKEDAFIQQNFPSGKFQSLEPTRPGQQ